MLSIVMSLYYNMFLTFLLHLTITFINFPVFSQKNFTLVNSNIVKVNLSKTDDVHKEATFFNYQRPVIVVVRPFVNGLNGFNGMVIY
jgi:hypothetical protein